MELIIVIIGIGLSLIFNIIAIAIFHDFVQSVEMMIVTHFVILKEILLQEHKKTRKETQEIKTRLTQVRKDLNVIEKKNR